MNEEDKPNICFLDFDGVFVNTVSSMLMKQTVEPKAIFFLNKLFSENNFKIVVSSTWRLGETYLTLASYLKLVGISTSLHKDFKTTEKHNKLRGNQIKEWLDAHEGEYNNYIIIDDDVDMLEDQIDNFCHVDPKEGFGAVDYHKCLKILGLLRENQEYLTRRTVFKKDDLLLDNNDSNC